MTISEPAVSAWSDDDLRQLADNANAAAEAACYAGERLRAKGAKS